MFLAAFHALSAFAYGYAIRFDYEMTARHEMLLPVQGVYVSKFVWLTMINLYLQFAYNAYACILCLVDAMTGGVRRRFLFDRIATVILFPVALTVVVLFWALVILDPNFLMNEDAKRILAIAWFNHTIHTLPVLTVLVDLFGWRHTRSPKLTAMIHISLFVCLYLAGVHYVYYAHNFWAYPILGALDAPQRAAFIAACVLFFFGAFLIGDALLAVVGAPRITNLMMAKKSNKKVH